MLFYNNLLLLDLSLSLLNSHLLDALTRSGIYLLKNLLLFIVIIISHLFIKILSFSLEK